MSGGVRVSEPEVGGRTVNSTGAGGKSCGAVEGAPALVSEGLGQPPASSDSSELFLIGETRSSPPCGAAEACGSLGGSESVMCMINPVLG